MDRHRFDALVRSLTIAHSRRHALGIALASLAVLDASDAAGKRKKKKVTICFNGQTVKVLKKKRDTFLLAGATLGACSPHPPPTTTTTPDPCAGQPAGAPCPPCLRKGVSCFPGNAPSDDCCSGVCVGTSNMAPGICASGQDEGVPCYDNTDCNNNLGFTCVNFKCHKP